MSLLSQSLRYEDLVPKMYTIQGTPEPSRSILRAVINKDPETVRKLLTAVPPGVELGWRWEPYNVLVWPKQFEALKLVLDDPRFRFDAEFMIATFYFTNRRLQDTVMLHPRGRRWFSDYETKLEPEYLECLRVTGRPMNVGLSSRLWNVKDFMGHYVRRRQRWALAFLLYPALRFWAQRRVEEFYAPGGAFALRAAEHFAAAAPKLCNAPPPLSSSPSEDATSS